MTFESRSEVTTWDASHGDEIRRHTSKEILESDAVLLSWLLGMLHDTFIHMLLSVKYKMSNSYIIKLTKR